MRGTELSKEYEEESSKQKEHHTLRPGRRKELGLLLELKGSQEHWSIESQETEIRRRMKGQAGVCPRADLTRALKKKSLLINV